MRHGFLLIHKPLGPTSHDVVAEVRRVLGERSIGHLGTLDPAASGLLVLAVGAKALKVVELFQDLSKEYEATLRLGAVSSTYDREGVIEEVVRKPGVEIPEQTTIQRLLQDRFIGKIVQVPPAHSAVKVGGTRAYRHARAGTEVQMPERQVEIVRCDVVSYVYPLLTLRIACSSGTYIRSLAHDLGQMLHTGGYLDALVRTRVGEWALVDAVLPEKVVWTNVMPLKDILKEFPRIDLSAEAMDDVRHGRNIQQQLHGETIGWYEDLPVVILDPISTGGAAHPRKVL